MKEWDRGYLVVDAEYAHSPEPVEEYIDLAPALEDLHIDPVDYLPRIREVWWTRDDAARRSRPLRVVPGGFTASGWIRTRAML